MRMRPASEGKTPDIYTVCFEKARVNEWIENYIAFNHYVKLGVNFRTGTNTDYKKLIYIWK